MTNSKMTKADAARLQEIQVMIYDLERDCSLSADACEESRQNHEALLARQQVTYERLRQQIDALRAVEASMTDQPTKEEAA